MFNLDETQTEVPQRKKRTKCFPIDGIEFDSKVKAQVYTLLKFKLIHGMIRTLFNPANGHPVIKVKGKSLEPDFVFVDSEGKEVFVKIRTSETVAWNSFKKAWKDQGPGRLEVYKANRYRAFLYESIPGKNV